MHMGAQVATILILLINTVFKVLQHVDVLDIESLAVVHLLHY